MTAGRWFRAGMILLISSIAVGVSVKPPDAGADAAALPSPLPAAAAPASPSPRPLDFTVCIDAGHGGADPGSICSERAETPRLEKDDTLRLARQTKEFLEEKGFTVIMTRSEDVYMETEARPRFANAAGADVFVSIHRNMYAGEEDVSGIEAWIGSDAPPEETDLCAAIFRRFETLGHIPLRGVHSGTMRDSSEDYIVNHHALMPSCILELGFISSEHDNRMIDLHGAAYARAIADGIEEYYLRSK